MTKRLRLFFDGGCEPNSGKIASPVRMESAVVARGVTYIRCEPGHGDNNDAEWRALLHAVEIALSLGAADIELLGDSAYVVAGANGKAPDRRGYAARFQSDIKGLARVRVRYIPRSRNLAGIALADPFRDRR